jgi:hypothetical protein
MKGPKPQKCVVVFDMQQALEIAKHSHADLSGVNSEDLE